MRLCSIEDSGALFLEPITLTRPAFDVRCGVGTVGERQQRFFAADEFGGWIRPNLVAYTRLSYPGTPINDADWLASGPAIAVNARWLAPADVLTDRETPRVGLVGDQVAYVVGAEQNAATLAKGGDAFFAKARKTLPCVDAGGVMLDFLWDVVDRCGDTIDSDLSWFRANRPIQGLLPAHVSIMGAAENLVIVQGAQIEPYVTADTRGGPVIVDEGAVVHSFTRLEGPCYIGKNTWVLGAKIRAGTALGPCCRIGGEVEASVVQGHSNKYHEGFLGHSYVGEWVNLAAATQTSDLRNDYGTVRLTVNGQRMSTGRHKVGSYIGDHTKSGLGALLNTGSVIGAFCNILPSGSLLPQIVPSYCQVQYGQVHERWDLRQMFATATTAMSRRSKEFGDAHRLFFDELYESTAPRRRRTIHEYEMRRMKRLG